MTKHLKIEVVAVVVVVVGEEMRRAEERRPTFFFQHLHSSSGSGSSIHLSLRWLASLKKEPGGREKAEVRRTSVGEQ